MDFQILVNKEHLLDEDYVPSDLVLINEPMGSKLDPNYVNKLHKYAYEMFKEMQSDALKNGYEIFVDSSYRSFDYQKQIFDNLAKAKGISYAERYCAIPGSSEHQTGLAFDVIARRDGVMIENCNENDPELIWLKENAYKYGFILRYPKGKEAITGYAFEPWHFRFVDKDLSNYMHDNNIETLEEYYTLMKTNVR